EDWFPGESRREPAKRRPRVTCLEQQLREDLERFRFLFPASCALAYITSMLGRGVIIAHAGRRNHQVVVSIADRLVCGPVERNHRIEATSRFRVVATVLGE